MATKKTQKKKPIDVEAFSHDDKRKNIPSAEHESVMEEAHKQPKPVRYPRNIDLDPQLVWRGKDEQDWSDLVVHAPPLYIQERIHPKALIDDLKRTSRESEFQSGQSTLDLFTDFNGLPKNVDRTEFYQHDQNWTNRMILGDSLQVMASLAEREGLRGKVQCIYLDPPYGIKFNSNFQWSTTSRDVKDGNAAHITREPEQVKAFRDTWRDGIHSYLTYLRDRLTVARDLLADSGSIFVQIGDENVHRVRVVMDEVFGDENCVAQISVKKTSGATGENLAGTTDFVLFYAKKLLDLKYRQIYISRQLGDDGDATYTYFQDEFGERRRLKTNEVNALAGSESADRIYRLQTLSSQSLGRSKGEGAASWFPVTLQGRTSRPSMSSRWKTNESGMTRLKAASRLELAGASISYIRFHGDFPVFPVTDLWMDTQSGSAMEKTYVVQTSQKIVERCLLMATDPGDLVLDPTCGSGTTAHVAEQWGRRWITIDTSRVALALARARLMGTRYSFYLLADSAEGHLKEAEISRRAYVQKLTHGKVRQGFVYERVPHITLKAIANNAEIDVISDTWKPRVQDALDRINAALRGHKKAYCVNSGGRDGKDIKFDASEGSTFTMPSGEVVKTYEFVEWEVPREAPTDWPTDAKKPFTDFWDACIARQKEIDASIAAKAECEYLYDKPYEDKKKVRVAGPFTVESLSPHRMLGVDENDELIDPFRVQEQQAGYKTPQRFEQMILENLKSAGVQQAHKEDRIVFTSLVAWPGQLVCAEGRYMESETEKRAGIFIGQEFGTVGRADLVDAAREAADAGFDVVIACAFSYDAHAGEFNKLGRVPVLKARMNADLHMATDLKATGKGNLFVIFGEPDIVVNNTDGGQLTVQVRGVDVFDPSSGEIRSDDTYGIACWMLDTDYNGESFFVRHCYFLGQNDPYKALKTTLKAEIDADAWASINSDTSRPFDKPKSGRIAVKVINHLGDEVMKVFRVDGGAK